MTRRRRAALPVPHSSWFVTPTYASVREVDEFGCEVLSPDRSPTCQGCGVVFAGRADRRWCSDRCHKRAKEAG